MFIRAGVVCEQSNDPIGVELAGAAKNAAGLAAGATEAQGMNAAGAAAGHIFAEVWRYADGQGARPESLLGLAGTGDLVATVLAPQSRNRRAGELLAAGVPAAEIPERIGQTVESLESVPLLARALNHAGSRRRSPTAWRSSSPASCRSTTGSRSCARPCRPRRRAGARRAGLLDARVGTRAGAVRARGRADLTARRYAAPRRVASVVTTAS